MANIVPMVIDSHCHAGIGFGLTDPWNGRPLLEKYLRRAAYAGITHTILFANFHEDYATANRIVAIIVNRNALHFCGFAYVHAQRDNGKIYGMARTAVEEYGFVGMKVHRHDARITREVCETARAFALPVLYDVENELPSWTGSPKIIPTVPFIIPHLGSFGENLRPFQPVANNVTPRARASNRWVKIFFDSTSSSCTGCSFRHFFAEYDLRAGPDPAVNPNMTPDQRRARVSDVNDMVNELLPRLDARAAAALRRATRPSNPVRDPLLERS